MDQIPFLDLVSIREEIGPELDAALTRVSASGRYLLGPELERFEERFAAYCEVDHCVGVGSGMSAIELTLRACGIGPGDEVLVPAYTWIATWSAVSQVGARPIAVDVEEGTYNMDVAAARAAIGGRTAALVPVHLRGEPANMEAIAALASKHGLAVIEDAAQAHGARHRGRRVGGLGKAAAFSFYPGKNLGAMGDGGAVTTDDAELASKVRLLRNYGMKDRYEFESAGVNSRLAEIQAAVLGVKLERLDHWNHARRQIAQRYLAAASRTDAVGLPTTPSWAEPVWHLFAVGHRNREALSEELSRQGIQTLVHYPVLPHQSPVYRDGPSIPPDGLPVAERLAARELSLPLFPQMTAAAVERVATAVEAATAA